MANTAVKFLRMSVLATALASSAFANWVPITFAEYVASVAAPFNQFNARYRYGATGSELYLGKGSLAANRVEKNVSNWLSGTAKAFSFSYDLTGGGTAKANLAGGAAPGDLTRLQNPLPTSIPFLFMSLNAGTGQSIDLKNMKVGGNAIADLAYSGGSGEKFYKLATNAFTSSSTGLTGDMIFSFPSATCGECVKVDIRASTVPEPSFYGLLAAGLGGLFMMRRRSRQQV